MTEDRWRRAEDRWRRAEDRPRSLHLLWNYIFYLSQRRKARKGNDLKY